MIVAQADYKVLFTHKVSYLAARNAWVKPPIIAD